jgi:hypothetical protein
MGVGGEQDFRVLQLEAERLDGSFDEGRRSFEAGVDQNIARRGRDQVGGQVVSNDVL